VNSFATLHYLKCGCGKYSDNHSKYHGSSMFRLQLLRASNLAAYLLLPPATKTIALVSKNRCTLAVPSQITPVLLNHTALVSRIPQKDAEVQVMNRIDHYPEGEAPNVEVINR